MCHVFRCCIIILDCFMCDEDHCDAGCKKPGKPTEVITWHIAVAAVVYTSVGVARTLSQLYLLFRRASKSTTRLLLRRWTSISRRRTSNLTQPQSVPTISRTWRGLFTGPRTGEFRPTQEDPMCSCANPQTQCGDAQSHLRMFDCLTLAARTRAVCTVLQRKRRRTSVFPRSY